MTDDFERARAAGRDRRDHVEADAAAEHIEYELRRERRLARDAREIVRHTMTVFGVFTGGIGLLVTLVTTGITSLIVMNILVDRVKAFPPLIAIIPGTLLVGLPALGYLRAWQESRRERAWLVSLPFELPTYWTLLGTYPRKNQQEITLRIRFAGDAPSERDLLDLVSGDGGQWTAANGGCRREPGPRSDWRVRDHNRPLRAWMHRFAAEQLLPLHGRYPIASIELVSV